VFFLIQRIIELGKGYGDIYELCEQARLNKDRIHRAFIFSSKKDGKEYHSIAIALKPTNAANFFPIYMCGDGIPNVQPISKRLSHFIETLDELQLKAVHLDIRHSSSFADSDLFYQYLIGILRLNHFIPPLEINSYNPIL